MGLRVTSLVFCIVILSGFFVTFAHAEVSQEPLSVASTQSLTLVRPLELRTSGEDVLRLQQLLNEQPGLQVAQTGPGSRGQETGFFGPATEAAVKRFQAMHAAAILAPLGLAEPTGIVGNRTWQLLASTPFAFDSIQTRILESLNSSTRAATPTCTLTANPSSIASGGSATLNWSHTNAARVTLTPDVGEVSTSKLTESVRPTVTTQYILTVANQAGQTAVCRTTITVAAASVIDLFSQRRPTTVPPVQSPTTTPRNNVPPRTLDTLPNNNPTPVVATSTPVADPVTNKPTVRTPLPVSNTQRIQPSNMSPVRPSNVTAPAATTSPTTTSVPALVPSKPSLVPLTGEAAKPRLRVIASQANEFIYEVYLPNQNRQALCPKYQPKLKDQPRVVITNDKGLPFYNRQPSMIQYINPAACEPYHGELRRVGLQLTATTTSANVKLELQDKNGKVLESTSVSLPATTSTARELRFSQPRLELLSSSGLNVSLGTNLRVEGPLSQIRDTGAARVTFNWGDGSASTTQSLLLTAPGTPPQFLAYPSLKPLGYTYKKPGTYLVTVQYEIGYGVARKVFTATSTVTVVAANPASNLPGTTSGGDRQNLSPSPTGSVSNPSGGWGAAPSGNNPNGLDAGDLRGGF